MNEIILYRWIDKFNINTLRESIFTNSRWHTFLNTTNDIKLAKEYWEIIIEYKFNLKNAKLKYINIDERITDIYEYDKILKQEKFDWIEILIGWVNVCHYRTKRKLLILNKIYVYSEINLTFKKLIKLNPNIEIIKKA